MFRDQGTERARTGEYDGFYPARDEGYFVCKACGNPLYSAEAKFKRYGRFQDRRRTSTFRFNLEKSRYPTSLPPGLVSYHISLYFWMV